MASIFLVGFSSYAPLIDGVFEVESSSMSVRNYNLNYKTHISDDSYSHEWLAEQLAITSEKLLNFAEKNRYLSAECRPVNELDIFTIDIETLNDRDKFNSFEGSDSDIELWGLFDYRLNQHHSASIILTDHSKYNEILFAHELSHYWAYRFCWDFFHIEKDSERIAKDFEIFYISGE